MSKKKQYENYEKLDLEENILRHHILNHNNLVSCNMLSI